MSDAKEASELAGILEEYLIRCLFSKNWQLREAALQYLEKRLTGQVSSSLGVQYVIQHQLDVQHLLS